MKIKTILIAAMLAVSGLTQAQVSEDAFKKAVDYLNCKTVELSLKSKPDVLEQYKKSCSCKDGASFNEINDLLNSVSDVDATIALANEIESLKTSYSKSCKTNKDAIWFLTETAFKDKTKYKKIVKFADKRNSDATFTTFKSDLQKELLPILSTSTKLGLSTADIPAPDNGNKVTGSGIEKMGWLSNNINKFVIIWLILLSMDRIFFVIRKLKKLKKDVEDKNHEESVSRVNPNKIENHDKISELENKVKTLESEMNKLKSKVDNAKIPFEDVQPQYEQQSWQDTKQSEVKLETFFLSTPNPDGSFNEDAASFQYKEGASIYKFVKLSPNKAEFEIDMREFSVKLALQYPELRIDPCCIPLNAFNSKAKKIRTSKKGVAELNGNKWELKSKAEINYES